MYFHNFFYGEVNNFNLFSLQTMELTTEAVNFLTELFNMFDVDNVSSMHCLFVHVILSWHVNGLNFKAFPYVV